MTIKKTLTRRLAKLETKAQPELNAKRWASGVKTMVDKLLTATKLMTEKEKYRSIIEDAMDPNYIGAVLYAMFTLANEARAIWVLYQKGDMDKGDARWKKLDKTIDQMGKTLGARL